MIDKVLYLHQSAWGLYARLGLALVEASTFPVGSVESEVELLLPCCGMGGKMRGQVCLQLLIQVTSLLYNK